jgi:hypothetical protein
MAIVKIFFTVDIHGSTACFKKFIKALEVYKADIGILGGDLSGKMVVPIIIQDDGSYLYDYMGEKILAKNKDELKDIEKKLAYMGNYYYYMTIKEYEDLKAEGKTIEGRIDEKAKKITLVSGKLEDIFREVVTERIHEWMEYAEEKLKKLDKKIYIIPGNDDIPEVDEVFRAHESDHIIFADLRKVEIDGHEMIGLSWSNRTPWDTPREADEETLWKMIKNLADQIDDYDNALFQLHVPPHGTLLDEAPTLSDDLTPSVSEVSNVGSTAVLRAIKEYQPLIGLHGHIHESRGIQKIGRTIIVNPGSEYSEAILRGVLLMVGDKKLKNYIFTSG